MSSDTKRSTRWVWNTDTKQPETVTFEGEYTEWADQFKDTKIAEVEDGEHEFVHYVEGEEDEVLSWIGDDDEAQERLEDARTEIFNHLLKESQKGNDKATEAAVNYLLDTREIVTTHHEGDEEIWLYTGGQYVDYGDVILKQDIRLLLKHAYRVRLENQIVNKIKAETYTRFYDFVDRRDTRGVCLENGIFDLDDLELKQHTPERVFFNKIPHRYHQNSDCDKIKEHLHTVLDTEEDVRTMQEIIGFTLMPEYTIEKAVMFVGEGRNGKSKTIQLIKNLLGHENTSGVTLEDLQEDDFAMHDLHHKLANICGDIGSNTLQNTNKVKQLTGRDTVSANRKHSSRINFESYSTLIFSANELPRTYDDSRAFWERWVLMDFPVTFVEDVAEEDEDDPYIREMDPDLMDKLDTEEEMRGLLRWAIQGLVRLLENNDFSKSPSSTEVKRKWASNSNTFASFAMDCLEHDTDKNVRKDDLRQAYQRYCDDENLSVEQPMNKTIKKYVRQNFISDEKTTSLFDDRERVSYWENVRLKEDYEVVQEVGSKEFSRFSEDAYNASLAVIEAEEETIDENLAEDGQRGSYANLKAHIEDLAAEHDDGAPIEDLIERGFDEEDIEDVKQRGDVIENPAGYLKII